MIVEKLEIKHFGMLTDMTLEFSDSLNVLQGQNEVGKSTVAAFIKYMLYGFDTDTAEGISERQKRVQWQTGLAEGHMVVRVRGKRYILYRSTQMSESGGRTVYKEDSSITDAETGTPAFGKSPAGEVFFGADRALFENTAFIGAADSSHIHASTVKEAIENILFSGSEKISNSRALDKLDDKMESLQHKNGAGGAISDLLRQKEALEGVLRSAGDDNRRILEKEAELFVVRKTKGEAEEKRTKLLELDAYYKNVMLIQTFDKLHELEQEAEDKAEAYRSFTEEHTYNGFLPSDAYLADLRRARQNVHETFDARRTAQAVYAERQAAPGVTKEIEGAIAHADTMGGESGVSLRAKTLRSHVILCLSMAVLAVLSALAIGVMKLMPSVTFTDGAPGTVLLCLGALLLAGGTVALIFALRETKALRSLCGAFGVASYRDLLGKLSVITEVRGKRDSMLRAVEDARLAQVEADRRYAEAKELLTDLILRWSNQLPDSDLDGFLDEFEERIEKFLTEKAAKWEAKNLTELTVKEIRRTLSDKSEIDIRAGVSPLKRKALAEINHDEIINGLAQCRTVIEEQEQLAFRVESELDLLKNRAVDPTEVHSKMQRLSERIEELTLRFSAYEMARDAIEHASESLRESISPRLGAYVTDMMGKMTDRKYTSLDVSDGMRVSFTDASGDVRSVDFLSDGTQDMVYMATRMALIDMLYSEKPPLIFDETFAHQDNERSLHMMKAIGTLSEEGYQSFIFTCRGREATMARDMDAHAGIFKLSVGEEE